MACKHVDDGRELHKAMPMPQGIQRIYVRGSGPQLALRA